MDDKNNMNNIGKEKFNGNDNPNTRHLNNSSQQNDIETKLNKGRITNMVSRKNTMKKKNDGEERGSSDASGEANGEGVGENNSPFGTKVKATNNGLSENNSKSDVEIVSPKKSNLKFKIALASSALSTLGYIITFALIVSILYSVGDSCKEFFEGIFSVFEPTQEELEKKYYNKLDEIQDDKYEDEEVCIDINLITAALTVDVDFKQSVHDGEEQDQAEKDYKRMEKQVERLANMQIKHINYGWDTRLTVENGDAKCYPSNAVDSEGNPVEEGTEVVNESNSQYFDPDDGWLASLGDFVFGKDDYVSTTPEIVAQNDLDGFAKFFTKKANHEKNYEYNFYRPVAKSINKGTQQQPRYEDVCEAELPEDYAEISIGEPGDVGNTADQGVFYWNLRNSFIADYYADYLPSEDYPEEREERIAKIAADIYILYKTMGPSMNCENKPKKDKDDKPGQTGPQQFTDSVLCPDGIMVEDSETHAIEVHYLEEYVAGVVAAENNWHEGDNIENMKAQAIAARSFALAHTGGCTTSIINGPSTQAYKKTDDEYALRAAFETAGIVLRNADGSIYHAQYDAFCVKTVVGDIYTIKQKNQEIPKSFLLTQYLTPEKTYADINYCFGHGYGMSQIGSRYLQHTGNDHEYILHYYYGDGINIDKTNQGSGVGPSLTGPWSEWRQCSKPWGTISMPAPRGFCTNICNCGCAITSLAIQIARSGVPTTLDPNFNPGTFFEAIKYKFGNSNLLPSWDIAYQTGVAPAFRCNVLSYAASSRVSQISEQLNQGRFVIAGVETKRFDQETGQYVPVENGHWVAVVQENGDSFDIADPAGAPSLANYEITKSNGAVGDKKLGSLISCYIDGNAPGITPQPLPEPVPQHPDIEPGAFVEGSMNGMKYFLYSPQDTNTPKPLIVYLHGDGGSGADKAIIKADGGTNFMGMVENYKYYYDAYILMPQSEARYVSGIKQAKWDEEGYMTKTKEIIDYVVNHNSISKVSIWGYSRGTAGVHILVSKNPGYFNNAVVLANYNRSATGFSSIPTYGIVGKSDGAHSNTQDFITAVKGIGNTNAFFKDYDNQGHGGLPTTALSDTSLNIVNWAISQ